VEQISSEPTRPTRQTGTLNTQYFRGRRPATLVLHAEKTRWVNLPSQRGRLSLPDRAEGAMSEGFSGRPQFSFSRQGRTRACPHREPNGHPATSFRGAFSQPAKLDLNDPPEPHFLSNTQLSRLYAQPFPPFRGDAKTNFQGAQDRPRTFSPSTCMGSRTTGPRDDLPTTPRDGPVLLPCNPAPARIAPDRPGFSQFSNPDSRVRLVFRLGNAGFLGVGNYRARLHRCSRSGAKSRGFVPNLSSNPPRSGPRGAYSRSRRCFFLDPPTKRASW